MSIYDQLATRCYVSRGFAKRYMMMAAYGGDTDPWLAHVMNGELVDLGHAWLRHKGLVTRPVTR
jgi:hypothetical protein